MDESRLTVSERLILICNEITNTMPNQHVWGIDGGYGDNDAHAIIRYVEHLVNEHNLRHSENASSCEACSPIMCGATISVHSGGAPITCQLPAHTPSSSHMSGKYRWNTHDDRIVITIYN